MFDNSDYPESSPYFYKKNKKVIGKFKDEAAGVPVCEFVGLRSKMYSYIKDNQKGDSKQPKVSKRILLKVTSIISTTKKHYSITNRCII